jgi:hypothetical protein
LHGIAATASIVNPIMLQILLSSTQSLNIAQSNYAPNPPLLHTVPQHCLSQTRTTSLCLWSFDKNKHDDEVLLLSTSSRYSSSSILVNEYPLRLLCLLLKNNINHILK